MKNAGLFLLSMVATAGMFFAGAHVDADGEKAPTPPLAEPSGVAVIDGCEVTGRIVQKTNGVYVAFETSNPSPEARSVEIHYVAQCTPGMNLMSRMGPVTREVKRGSLIVQLGAGESTTQEVQAEERPYNIQPANVAATNVPAQQLKAIKAFVRSPDIWTLTVARGEVQGVAASFGASVPGTPQGKVVLDEGQMTIARTVVKQPEAEAKAG